MSEVCGWDIMSTTRDIMINVGKGHWETIGFI